MHINMKKRFQNKTPLALSACVVIVIISVITPFICDITEEYPEHIHHYLWFSFFYIYILLCVTILLATMVFVGYQSHSLSGNSVNFKSFHAVIPDGISIFSCIWMIYGIGLGILHDDITWGAVMLAPAYLIGVPGKYYRRFVADLLSMKDVELGIEYLRMVYILYTAFIIVIAVLSLVVLCVYSAFYHIRAGIPAVLVLPWGVRYLLGKYNARFSKE